MQRLVHPSKLQEHIQGRLPDWDHVLQDIPEDSLREWSSGQGTSVGPSPIDTELLNELCQVKELVCCMPASSRLDKHFFQELVMVVGKSMNREFKVIGYCFEEEAQYTISELGLLVSSIWNNSMNDVHFKIEQLSIDGMLRRSMEMVLESLELGTCAPLVKKMDGLRKQVVVIGLLILHHELELLTLLVVLELLDRVDISILELECLILEVFKNGTCSLKIDRCLLYSIADNSLLFLLEKEVIGSEPIVLSELTWSLVESIQIVLGVIIIVIMLVLVGATRHTTNNW